MVFTIKCPDLAFLKFQVMDKDSLGEDDLVGVAIVPVSSVSSGIRAL